MARQLSGKNGVQISGGGSGGGGSGTTFVTTPEIRGGSRVAIGRPNEFSLSAMCLLSNARVLWFMVEATGGAIGGTFPATLEKDGKNTATVRITIPAGTQVGATIHITVTARDNYGNDSLPAEIAVTASEGYVTAPILLAPIPSAEVSSTFFNAVTSTFAVLGSADTQIASQYVVIKGDDSGDVLYDSGELTDSTEFTKHAIMLRDIHSVRAPITVQARHKGELNGWSDYSAPVECFMSPNVIVVSGKQNSAVTSDFETMSNFSATGYSLPSKTRIYNMYEFDDTYIALTQLHGFWQVFTSTDLLEWSGPYSVGLVEHFTEPLFGEFNKHLFLSGKHVARSSDKGKTWHTIAGGGLDVNANSGSFCSDEKYCYYVTSTVTMPSIAKSTVFRSSDGLVFSSLQVVDYNTDWYEALWGRGAALGQGLVIFSIRRGTALYVSNDFGETYKRVVVANMGVLSQSYNDHITFRFMGAIYSVAGTNIIKGAIDGLTWESPVNLNCGTIKGISVTETNIRFFGTTANGGPNTIKESKDMKSWTTEGSAPTIPQVDFCRYLRTKSGEDVIFDASYFRSKNGATWKSMVGIDTSHTLDINWNDSCYAFKKFFRVGGLTNSLGGYISSSVDGITWEPPALVCEAVLTKVRFDSNFVIASSESLHIVYAPKGEGHWVNSKVNTTDHSTTPVRIGVGSGSYVCVRAVTSSLNGVYYSKDLVTWNKAAHPSPPSIGTVGGVQFGVDRFMCILGGGYYDSYNKFSMYSLQNSGASWTVPVLLSINNDYAGVFQLPKTSAFGNDVFVFTGGSRIVVLNKTGAVVGTVTLPISINSLQFINNRFYASSTTGSIMTSTNGLTWSTPAVQALSSGVAISNSVITSNA